MRIALVNPVARRCEGYHTIGTRIPQLGLQVLARLVPDGHEVDIVDEIFGSAGTMDRLTSGEYDLVGLTAYTSGATRAYEIAGACREAGLPVIMGGPHAWAMPDEVQPRVDSVVVGECDEIWPGIVEDAAAGRLAPRYQGRYSDLSKGYGGARQELQPINGRYDVGCIQTSRGCPLGCEYCSVTRYNGPVIRRRPIGDIVEEWNETTRKFLFVVDDNFYGVGEQHAEWSRELLRAIIKHGKKRLWFSQTSLNMGNDPEALRLAYRAGCRGMLVGFESFNETSLEKYQVKYKSNLVSQYKRLVDGFHSAGLAVFGGFIIGADEDDENTVAETALKAVQVGVDIIQITNLTPLPGTRLFDRWLEEGKIFATDFPEDWERYTFVETVFTPDGMSPKRLDETMYELRKGAAEESWVWKRTVRSFLKTRSLTTALFVHGMNRGWAELARNQVPRDMERFGYIPSDETTRARTLKRAWSLRPGE
ncbi:MAG: B12-binding domain-containing radical SAM protein [Phycisphaerae bacterium]